MDWLGICAVVALALAVAVWLFLGAAMEGVGTRYDSWWEKMRAGWWMLAGLFAVFLALTCGVSGLWRWLVG